MIKVLVCGGRDYQDKDRVFDILDQLHKKHQIVQIIHGVCPGADLLGETWAKDRQIAYLGIPAKWATEGRSAGPIRNQRMLDEGVPDIVVAFPGNRGTEGMIRLAEKAGVKVQRVDNDADKEMS